MPNMTFERLAGHTLIVRGPTNIGIVEVGEGEALLVDSGNDEDAGRKLLRACEAAGLKIICIANTHSNADHCGGNAFIQSHTNCRIVATAAEAAFIETPTLEPSFLWGGFPLPALRNKFLMPQASHVTDIIAPPCLVPQSEIKALPLPGHFFAMAGFMTPDKVFFAADTLASPQILAKYHVFYMYDVAAFLETLDGLLSLGADWIVPSHAPPTQDLASLIKTNKEKVFEIASFIVAACVEPSTPEKLLSDLVAHFEIELTHTQYVLLGSTLKSYLAWLVQKKSLSSRIEKGYMLFERN
jgi:glyoxylase-like metal-dependent hydrolase (beta-lactamase superfamily II)